MSKVVITIALLLLLMPSIDAQQRGRIVYKASLVENNFLPIYEELIFENGIASYTLIRKENPDRVVFDETTGEVLLFNESPDSIHPVILVDHLNKTILSRVYLSYDNNKTFQEYYVKEGFEIEWNITGQVRKISGYNCRAATAYFRGRSYTAWFTTDIPVFFGPWKFQGLPGLVILVEDSNKEVSIVVDKIEIPTQHEVKRIETPGAQSAMEYTDFCKLKKLARDSSGDEFIRMVKAKLPRGAKIEESHDSGPNTIEKDCW